MVDISDYFDATKKYKEIEIQPGALVVADDISLIQDIVNYDRREMAKYFQGFQLKRTHMVNAPVLKVRANNLLTEGQVITIEMIDATHAKWKHNSGAYSGSIVVVCNGVTWNTLGTSGLDVIFSSTVATADISEVWVAQGMRLLGGDIDSPLANTYRLLAGKWNVLGEFEDFVSAKTVGGTSDGDYLYLKVETAQVTYLADVELGTRLADGAYDPKSPIADNRVYTLLAGATFPENTTSPLVQYFIVGKVKIAAAGTFTYMWEEPYDIQKLVRIYGDTTAPTVPTGLALTTGSEAPYVATAIERAGSMIPLNGYLTMACTQNNEPDVDYYEFKVARLATPGGAITTQQFSQIVKLNMDAGGVGIPIGVSFTLRNQTFGVPYGVFVRAVDYAGNCSAWSARVDAVIGGTTGGIGGAVLGPTFTLVDTAGFVGVDVVVTALPANCEGYGIWVQEGSYPTASPGTEYNTYGKSVGTVSIPWKESGHPYIRIRGFDAQGIYQTLSSQTTISLAASAQLASESHNAAITSHGGVLSGLIDVASRFGTTEKFFAMIEAQGFAIDAVYVVSAQGGFYQTIQGALNAILDDAPEVALVLVCPDYTDSGGTITFPDLYSTYAFTKVIIQGFGCQVSISDDIDISTLASMPSPLSAPLVSDTAQLVLKDLRILGRIYSVWLSVNGQLYSKK
jgi:hypothetical protein